MCNTEVPQSKALDGQQVVGAATGQYVVKQVRRKTSPEWIEGGKEEISLF